VILDFRWCIILGIGISHIIYLLFLTILGIYDLWIKKCCNDGGWLEGVLHKEMETEIRRGGLITMERVYMQTLWRSSSLRWMLRLEWAYLVRLWGETYIDQHTWYWVNRRVIGLDPTQSPIHNTIRRIWCNYCLKKCEVKIYH